MGRHPCAAAEYECAVAVMPTIPHPYSRSPVFSGPRGSITVSKQAGLWGDCCYWFCYRKGVWGGGWLAVRGRYLGSG
jgi:hypothetical protein